MSEPMTGPLDARPALRGMALIVALVALSLPVLLAGLGQTVVGDALPDIISDLNGFTLYRWVVTAYLSAETAILPLALSVAISVGRRRMLVVGVAILLVGSALCGGAQTIQQLIAFRALQGLGAGICMASAIQIARANLAGWSPLIAVVFGLSSVVGPALGGWLMDHGPSLSPLITNASTWRWIFFVNLPVGLVALAAVAVALPGSRQSAGTPHWTDILRAALLCGACFLALLGFAWGEQTYPWQSWQVITVLGGAAMLFSFFLALWWIQRRTQMPSPPIRRIGE